MEKILLLTPLVLGDDYSDEIDFVACVFNASPVLKERAEMMAIHEGLTYEGDAEKRAPYAQRSLEFINRISHTLSKKMVRKVKDWWQVKIWPWVRTNYRLTHSV